MIGLKTVNDVVGLKSIEFQADADFIRDPTFARKFSKQCDAALLGCQVFLGPIAAKALFTELIDLFKPYRRSIRKSKVGHGSWQPIWLGL